MIELATVIAAPSAAAVLCDLGCDVIKVEEPTGDTWRHTEGGAGPVIDRQPVGFTQQNRGKRGIVLNLRTARGLQLMRELLSSADIFLTNVRSRALEKMGLDFPTISVLFPRLIFAHLSAWGSAGPKVDDPGYDFGPFWAGSGLMDYVRPFADSPMPRFPGGIGDNTTAMQLVAGIGLALYHRERTGRGQLVDTALFRSGMWCMSQPLMQASHGIERFTSAGRKLEADSERATLLASGSFLCADGVWLMMLGLETARHFPRVVDALGIAPMLLEEWKADIVANTRRADEIFLTKTSDEWADIFREKDVWFTPVRKSEDMMTDEQAISAGASVEAPGVPFRLVANPIKLSEGGPNMPRGPAPRLGQHSEVVLSQDLGLTPSEINALRAAGVTNAAETDV